MILSPNNIAKVAFPPAQAAQSAPTKPFISAEDQASVDDCITYAFYDGDVDPSVTSLTFNGTRGGLDIEIDSLTEFHAPNWVGSDSTSNYCYFAGSSLLTIDLPALRSIGYLWPSGCTSLTSLAAPLLEHIGDGTKPVTCDFRNTLLTELDFPSLLTCGGWQPLPPGITQISMPSIVTWEGGSTLGSATTTLDCGSLQTVGGNLVLRNPELVSVDLHSLQTVASPGGIFQVISPGLTTLNLSSLISAANFDFENNSSLSSISLSSLQSVENFTLNFSPLLTSLSLPSFTTLTGTVFDVQGCALDAASINGVLAKLVAANGGTFGPGKSVAMHGGTNAAPTGQGLIDKATLVARGATVTTN